MNIKSCSCEAYKLELIDKEKAIAQLEAKLEACGRQSVMRREATRFYEGKAKEYQTELEAVRKKIGELKERLSGYRGKK